MELDQRARLIRRDAKKELGYELTKGGRGWRVGSIDDALERAAARLSPPLEFGGGFRYARIKLAKDALNKESLQSYNQLTDSELHYLEKWAKENGKELESWLTETFGTQLSYL